MRRLVFIVLVFFHMSLVQPARLDYEETMNANDIDVKFNELRDHIEIQMGVLGKKVEAKCERDDSQSLEPPSFSTEDLLVQVEQKISDVEGQVFQKVNGLIIGMSLDVMRKIENLLQKVASKQDLEELKTQYTNTKQDLQELKDQNAATKQDLEELKTQYINTKQDLQELKDQNKATKQDLEELKAQNEASKKELEELNNQVATLAISEALIELEESLTGVAKTTSADVTRVMANLATKSDVDQSRAETENQLKEITQQLENVTSCNHRNDFDRVLELLTNADVDINNVASAMSASLTELKDTCLTRTHHDTSSDSLSDLLVQVKAAVEKNTQTITSVTEGINNVETDVTTRLVTLQDLIDKLHENMKPQPTQIPVTTTTTTTTTQRPITQRTLSPCENSQFVGGGVNLNVCEAAVRFKKCQLEFVAYHCCRSCSNAGMISEMGPHRYLNYGRNVSILKALQFMRP